MGVPLRRAEEIARQFQINAGLREVAPHPGGHIHDSFLVSAVGPQSPRRFLLQRLNEHVFPQPELVMENIARVTGHLERASEALQPVPTISGGAHPEAAAAKRFVAVDSDGGKWRMFRFVEGTRSILTAECPAQAYEASRAIGLFQHALAELPPPRLHEVIPGFHDTPRRLGALQRAIAQAPINRLREARAEIEFALAQSPFVSILTALHQADEIPERVVHNDAKLANVLFDEAGRHAVCVVDLDTVMPGLSLYDFGDMVRSMTCRSAEDDRDLEDVRVDPELFEGVVRGYLSATSAMLRPAEKAHLFEAGRLISLEQAIRFLTDHLEGDIYFRTSRPGQNLDRCRTQLRLVGSLDEQETHLRRIVDAAVAL